VDGCKPLPRMARKNLEEPSGSGSGTGYPGLPVAPDALARFGSTPPSSPMPSPQGLTLVRFLAQRKRFL